MSDNKIQTVKSAPPPPDLPALGKINPAEVSFIGRTNYVAALEEKKYIFGIKRIDRRRHLYIIGKSGVGKSKLLELLVRQDIAFGYGVCVLDPNGDLIDSLLDFIPEERIKDTVFIDPSNASRPLFFNPLADVDADFKHQLTQSLVEIIERRFGSGWTPRLEHVFRFTTLALLDYPKATLADMMKMLTDGIYRASVLEHVKDEMVRQFFSIEFDEWSDKFGADAIAPLMNELGQIFSDPALGRIFGQHENRLDLGKMISENKIILIQLSRSKLGEENSNFFGSVIMAKIKQAGLNRMKLAAAERKDFYIYIDEFQNLITQTFEYTLTDARKNGFSLTLAHQYLEQLSPQVRAAIFGSIGTLTVFRVGGADATLLESELAPIFKAKDMINLGVREFYVKLTIDSQSYDPFSAETLKVLPPSHPPYRDKIISESLANYYGSRLSV